MLKHNKCKLCGSQWHTAWLCKLKSKKPMRQEAVKTKAKRTEVRVLWFDLNPPDEYGRWQCYLRIAPNCYGYLTRETVDLEHVDSKARRPDLKFDVQNLKPACPPCNQLKGSRSAEEFDR